MNVKARYKIVRDYCGLFDSVDTICYTNSLFNAVFIVENLKKANEDNVCLDFDFKKLVNDLDETLDYYPGEGFMAEGNLIECKNYEEFSRKKGYL